MNVGARKQLPRGAILKPNHVWLRADPPILKKRKSRFSGFSIYIGDVDRKVSLSLSRRTCPSPCSYPNSEIPKAREGVKKLVFVQSGGAATRTECDRPRTQQ